MCAKQSPIDARPHPWPHPMRVGTLKRAVDIPVDLQSDKQECATIAEFMGLHGIASLRFKGKLVAEDDEGWVLTGRLTANLTQRCVVTLSPLPVRIDQKIVRHLVPSFSAGTIDLDPEDEDEADEFDDVIDPGVIALEELALALEPYPRGLESELETTVAAPPGSQPLTDEALKPFAGLAALKDKMQTKG